MTGRTGAQDFFNNITTNGVNGVYTTQQAHAFIIVNSTSVVPGSNGTSAVAGGGGGGGLSKGAIAGIVIGSVLGLLLLCCICCLLLGVCGPRRRERDVSEPSSAEASRMKREDRIAAPMGVAGTALAGAGLAGAATTAPDLSGEESVYRSYHTPPPPEVSDVDPDQSSQLHIHV